MKLKFTSKSLFIALLVTMLISSSFSPLAISAEESSYYNDYIATSNLLSDTDSYKDDDDQKNYQEADVLEDLNTTSLIQTAEWTDKENGEAEIIITYEADFEEESFETRALYIMNNCANHGFSKSLAVQNIITLLNNYDYVDVIMIYATSWAYYRVAVLQFSLFSSEFDVIDDDTVAEIGDLLEPYISWANYKDIADYEIAHAIGSKDDTTNGEFTKVTSNPTANFNKTGHHWGYYYSLYYLQEYYETITSEYSEDFDEVVYAIYNSFDGLAAAGYNAMDGQSSAKTLSLSHLYPRIESLVGYDFTSEETRLADMLDYVPNAVEILIQYDTEERYYAMVANGSTRIQGGAWNISSDWLVSHDETTTVNDIIYGLFLVYPSGLYNDEDTWRANVKEWLSGSHTINPLTDLGAGVYYYGQSFIEADAIDEQSGLTIATTIDSALSVNARDISISYEIAGDSISRPVRQITIEQDTDGNSVVTIWIPYSIFTNYTSLDEINFKLEISIDVTVSDSDKAYSFHTDSYGFKETNAADTTVNFYYVYTGINAMTNPDPYEETVSVASPVLYNRPQFTVTYDANGGNDSKVPTDEDKYYGETIVSIIESSDDDLGSVGDGVVFMGWSLDASYSTDEPVDNLSDYNAIEFVSGSYSMPYANLKLYGVWAKDANHNNIPDFRENDYSIVYMTNDDEDGGSVYATDEELIPEYKYTLLEVYDYDDTKTPTIGSEDDGVVFLGWSESNKYNTKNPVTSVDDLDQFEFVTEYTFEVSETDKTYTVYAVWAIDSDNDGVQDYYQFSLRYSKNGGDGDAPVDNDFYDEDEVASLIKAYDYDDENASSASYVMGSKDDGIVFIGWSESAEYSAENPATSAPSSGTIIEEVTFGTSNKTVYAVWAIDENKNGVPDYLENDYSIVYKTNDEDDSEYAKDEELLPLITYTLREVYDFDDSDNTPNIGSENDGVVFLGWSESADYDTENPVTTLDELDDVVFVTEHTFKESETEKTYTVYAVWAIDSDNDGVEDYYQFTLSYDANGGYGEVPTDSDYYDSGEVKELSEAYDYSASAPLGATVMGRDNDGVVFVGWSLSDVYDAIDNPAVEKPADGVIITDVTFDSENITVYAVWALDANENGIADYYEYNITFNAGDYGVLVGVDDEYSVTYEYLLEGTSLANYVPEVQATSVFEFVGYRLEGDIKVYTIEEVKAMTIESDMIFTAVYNPQLTQVVIVDTSTKNN